MEHDTDTMEGPQAMHDASIPAGRGASKHTCTPKSAVVRGVTTGEHPRDSSWFEGPCTPSGRGSRRGDPRLERERAPSREERERERSPELDGERLV